MIILWDFIPDPLTSIQAHPSPTCPVQPPFAATLTSVAVFTLRYLHPQGSPRDAAATAKAALATQL